jgi:predicted MFS family arabinose efflux permease
VLRLTPGRDFRLIWTAGIVSQLGDWSARLALALLVLERSGTATTVGIVAALFVIPWLGAGQLLTAWSTRFGRRAVLIGCDTARGIAFVTIGTIEMPTAPLLVIVALAALVDPVFEATKSAFVTEIVPKDDYSEAIQVTHAANQASSLIGYALGGVLVGFFGAGMTLNLNGATFLVSSLLIILVSREGGHESEERAKPGLAAGIRFLRTDPISGIAFLATVVALATAMSVESQAAVYGKVVAGFSEEWIGILSAMTPAATLIAVTLLKTSGDDVTLLRRGLVIAAVAAAGGSALLFSGVGHVLAFAAFALVGVVFSFGTMTNVIVGRRLPDDNRVAIFSILQTGIFLGLSTGAVLGGVVSETTSPELAAGTALALAAASLVVAIPFLSRWPQPNPEAAPPP